MPSRRWVCVNSIKITWICLLTCVPDQAETVSRRVEKFAELMQSVWTSKNDYERRARKVGLSFYSISLGSESRSCFQLLYALEQVQDQWAASKFTGTYTDAKEQSAVFTTYKHTTKRTWVTERQDVTTLFGNIQTKLKTYGLREYIPPVGLALSVSSVPLMSSLADTFPGYRRCVE